MQLFLVVIDFDNFVLRNIIKNIEVSDICVN